MLFGTLKFLLSLTKRVWGFDIKYLKNVMSGSKSLQLLCPIAYILLSDLGTLIK